MQSQDEESGEASAALGKMAPSMLPLGNLMKRSSLRSGRPCPARMLVNVAVDGSVHVLYTKTHWNHSMEEPATQVPVLGGGGGLSKFTAPLSGSGVPATASNGDSSHPPSRVMDIHPPQNTRQSYLEGRVGGGSSLRDEGTSFGNAHSLPPSDSVPSVEVLFRLPFFFCILGWGICNKETVNDNLVTPSL